MYQENEVSEREQNEVSGRQQPQQPQRQQAAIKSKAFDFHWEKRHWILIIGLVCLALWYFAPQLKSTPWLQSALNLLPAIGGLIFATDSILKLAD